MSFCDWLASLSMSSRFIHVVACVRISFLFKADCLLYVYTTLYHSPVDGLLGYFHLLATVNNAHQKAMDGGFQPPRHQSFLSLVTLYPDPFSLPWLHLCLSEHLCLSILVRGTVLKVLWIWMKLTLGDRGRCVMSPKVGEEDKTKEGQMEGLLYIFTRFKPKRCDIEKARVRLSSFGFVWGLQIVLCL